MERDGRRRSGETLPETSDLPPWPGGVRDARSGRRRPARTGPRRARSRRGRGDCGHRPRHGSARPLLRPPGPGDRAARRGRHRARPRPPGRARRLAERTGDPDRLADVRATLGIALAVRGRSAAGLRELDRAVARGDTGRRRTTQGARASCARARLPRSSRVGHRRPARSGGRLPAHRRRGVGGPRPQPACYVQLLRGGVHRRGARPARRRRALQHVRTSTSKGSTSGTTWPSSSSSAATCRER